MQCVSGSCSDVYTCSVLVVPAQMCTHAVCKWSLLRCVHMQFLLRCIHMQCVSGPCSDVYTCSVLGVNVVLDYTSPHSSDLESKQ